jgi:hypothetical protein
MACRTADLLVLIIRMAPVVTCIFTGCTCSGKRAGTPDGARRALCERYVAAISGHGDSTLLDDPQVQALAAHAAPDLVMCGAVLADSDGLCQRLMPPGHGPSMACRHIRSDFHELRTYPNGRSFMFDEIDREECNHPACDSLLEAMRSGDAEKCALTADLQSICRAYITLDKSLCRLEGKQTEPNGGAQKGYGKEPGLEEGCRKTIESRGFLAQGLKALAESGPPRERALAKAALGQADACVQYAQSAMDLCLGNAPAR